MGFSTDYSDVKDGGGLLPVGEWEAIIKYAGEDVTKTSKTVYINVTMVLRNDVDQKYKNKYIWLKIWHRKDPTPADLSCGGYSSKQINSLSKAAGLPNNQKYESLADWCDHLKNKPVRVTVEHEEFNGEMQAKVKWTNETHFPDCKHQWKAAGADPSKKPVDVSADDFRDGPADFKEISDPDDDLPF